MKFLVLFAALALLLPAFPVQAQDFSARVLVVDKDPKGTNVRDTPSGKVVHVIPQADMRLATVSASRKGWFKVQADGASGWMHGSVLGICASGTEDGDPSLIKNPDNQSPPLLRIAQGSPVSLLALQGRWLKVRYVDAKGTKHDGWLPEQVFTLSENGMEECAAAWKRK